MLGHPGLAQASTSFAALPPLPKSDLRLQGPSPLLPDLRTLAPSGFYIQEGPTGRILRLANTVWNSGRGPLELVGETPQYTEPTAVRQMLFAEDGALRDRFVGTFIWHASHGHWHIEHFAEYRLWSLRDDFEVERVVAESTKVSYCLIDTELVTLDLSGAPDHKVYRGCGRTRQGLSVGWGDEYRAHLNGQSIELGDLPDGLYALVSTVNPAGLLVESDYANNSAVVYLSIIASKVTVISDVLLEKERCLSENDC